MRWIVAPLVIVAMAAVSTCAGPPPPDDPALYDIHAANGTTIPISIAVDGKVVIEVPAGGEVEIPSGTISRPPYTIELRVPSGRVLDSMPVAPGSVTQVRNSDGTGSASGVFLREDLSCGQFTLWLGIRPSGPAPGPGTPGDCDP